MWVGAGVLFRTQLQGLRQREARLTVDATLPSHMPRREVGIGEMRVQTVGDFRTEGGIEPDLQDRKSRGLNEILRSPFSYRVKENSLHGPPSAPAPLWKVKSYANVRERQRWKEKLGQQRNWVGERRDGTFGKGDSAHLST